MKLNLIFVSLLSTIITLFSTIQNISTFETSTSTTTTELSTFEKLFARFTDFLTDLKNPNHQHEKDYRQRLKYYQTQLTHTHVWLTVSSVVNVTGYDPDHDHDQDLLIRAIEIHWRRPTSPNYGDYLAIYRRDDFLQIRTYPLISDPKTNATFPHYYKTDLEFNYQNLTNLKQSPYDDPYESCLEYIVAYVNYQGNVESKNCIRLQPRWMEMMFDRIKDHRLSELMIPGTHDTSSYEKYSYDTYELDVLARFQYTQDESIYNQLAYGIRYMDWRVAVYNQTNQSMIVNVRRINRKKLNQSKSMMMNQSSPMYMMNYYEEFWMVHDMQRNRITLKQALRQVEKFLDRTTHEIVIIDFHRFVKGFDDESDLNQIRKRLKKFIDIIETQLGEYLIPFSLKGLPTIGNLVAQNKRVLIGYQYKFDVRKFPDSRLFWPPIKHLWANTDKLSELEQYIQKQICRQSRTFNNVHLLRSIMAELTPTVEGVLFRRYHGLRELASLVNINYEQWFRYRWHNCTNIVAADFFLGSDLVDIAIDINRQRFN